MTYSSGGLIQATDYNGFVSTTSGANINATWNTTYGQTALSTVSTGGTVTATQWASLVNTIAAMGAHSNTAITSRTAPVTGNTITALTNVGLDIGNCYTNRFSAASVGSQFTSWTGTASKTASTGSGASPWTITFTDTITFANTTAASSFFGAGGYLQVQFGKSSTGTVGDTEWNAFIGAAGAGGRVAAKVILTSDSSSKTINGVSYNGTYKTGGTGTPSTLATGTGYNQLTGTPVTIYKQFDTGAAYSSNYVQINASVSGAVVTLTTTWYDAGDSDPGSTPVITGGTATAAGTTTFGTAPTTLVTAYQPEQTNISNVWGSITISSSVA